MPDWKDVFTLVKPFKLSELDWTKRQFTPNWDLAGFADPLIYYEFNRFIHRDILPFLCGIIFSLLSFLNASTVFLLPDRYYIFQNCMAGLLFLDSLVLLYLSRIAEESTKQMALRKLVLTFTASLVIGLIAPASTNINTLCPHKTDYASWLRGNFERSPENIRKYCFNRFSSYLTLSVTVFVCAFRLSPHRIVFSSTVTSVVYFVSYWWSERYAQYSEREWATIVSLWSITIAQAVLIAWVRHMLQLRQFRQVVAAESGRQLAKIREKKVDGLLCAMLPVTVLNRLVAAGGADNVTIFDKAENATVLFSDMIAFTAWSSTRTPSQVVAMLNAICVRLDDAAVQLEVEKVKTIGDAYWAACGLPVARDDHADRVIAFGLAMIDIVDDQTKEHPDWGGVQFRIGISSGPATGAVLGTQRLSYEVFGSTSRIAEECEKNGVPRALCISEATLQSCLDAPRAGKYKVIVVDDDLTYGASAFDSELAETDSIITIGSEVSIQLFLIYADSVAPFRESPVPAIESGTWMGSGSFEVRQDFVASSGQRGTGALPDDAASITPLTLVPMRPGRYCSPVEQDQQHPSEIADMMGMDLNDNASSKGTRSFSPTSSYQRHPQQWRRRIPEDASAGSGASHAESELVDAATLQVQRERKEFANRRAAARRDHTHEEQRPSSTENDDAAQEASSDTREAVEAKFSPRRFTFGPMTFASTAIEAEYKQFVRRSNRPQLLTTRFLIISTEVLYMLVAVLVEEAKLTPSAWIWMLAGIAAHTTATVNVIRNKTSFQRDYDLKYLTRSTAHDEVYAGKVSFGGLVHTVVCSSLAESIFVHFAAWMFIIGAGLIPESFIGNDVAYLYPVYSLLLGFGNFTTGWIILGLLNIATALVCVPFLVPSLFFDAAVLFLSFSISFVLLIIYLNEKQMRQQFLDSLVAAHFVAEQEAAKAAHESLLADMVPDFVIPQLSEWIETGMPVDKSIAQHYDFVVVAFVKLEKPEGTTSADGGQWMLREHAIVDDVVAKYRCVEKIKTIGPLVMLAGPFDPPVASLRDAALAAQEMINAVKEIASATAVACAGVHVGEVMAAVLGTSRICFDIFGDVVNVASRAMSTTLVRGVALGTVVVTAEVLDALEEKPQVASSCAPMSSAGLGSGREKGGTIEGAGTSTRIEYGPIYHPLAKGKGNLSVCQLLNVQSAAL